MKFRIVSVPTVNATVLRGPSGIVSPVADGTLVGNVSGATAAPVGLAKPAIKTLLNFVEPSELTWASINSKPLVFPPSAHSHPLSDLTGLGTGVATALAIAVGSVGGPVVKNGDIGTAIGSSPTFSGTTTLDTLVVQNAANSSRILNVKNLAGTEIFYVDAINRSVVAGGDAFAVRTATGGSYLFNNGFIGWVSGSAASTGTPTSTISQQSAGVIQFGTTAAGAGGSIAAFNATLSGTVTVNSGNNHTFNNGTSQFFIQVAPTIARIGSYNGSGLPLAINAAGGDVRIGSETLFSGTPKVGIQTDSVAQTTLGLRGFPSYTGTYFECRDSANALKFKIDSSGGAQSVVNGFSAGGNAPLPVATAVLRTPNDYRIADNGTFDINNAGTLMLRLTSTGNMFVGGSTANYFDNPTTGGGRWQTPYAGTFTFKSGQSAQSMTLVVETAEGKTGGFQHWDLAHANGRRFDILTAPAVPITIRPAGTLAVTFDTSGAATFTSNTTMTGIVASTATFQITRANSTAAIELVGSPSVLRVDSGVTVSGGSLGFSQSRFQQPSAQVLQTQCFDTSLAAWQETTRSQASPTGAKWSVFGATPIIQQTLPAAATDPATTQSLCNAIRSLLLNFGFSN